MSPAVSRKQRRFMGMVHATQKGKISAPSPAVAEAAKSMKPSDTTDFASTKHTDLPEKKKKEAGVTAAVEFLKKSIGPGAAAGMPKATAPKLPGSIGMPPTPLKPGGGAAPPTPAQPPVGSSFAPKPPQPATAGGTAGIPKAPTSGLPASLGQPAPYQPPAQQAPAAAPPSGGLQTGPLTPTRATPPPPATSPAVGNARAALQRPAAPAATPQAPAAAPPTEAQSALQQLLPPEQQSELQRLPPEQQAKVMESLRQLAASRNLLDQLRQLRTTRNQRPSPFRPRGPVQAQPPARPQQADPVGPAGGGLQLTTYPQAKPTEADPAQKQKAIAAMNRRRTAQGRPAWQPATEAEKAQRAQAQQQQRIAERPLEYTGPDGIARRFRSEADLARYQQRAAARQQELAQRRGNVQQRQQQRGQQRRQTHRGRWNNRYGSSDMTTMTKEAAISKMAIYLDWLALRQPTVHPPFKLASAFKRTRNLVKAIKIASPTLSAEQVSGLARGLVHNFREKLEKAAMGGLQGVSDHPSASISSTGGGTGTRMAPSMSSASTMGMPKVAKEEKAAMCGTCGVKHEGSCKYKRKEKHAGSIALARTLGTEKEAISPGLAALLGAGTGAAAGGLMGGLSKPDEDEDESRLGNAGKGMLGGGLAGAGAGAAVGYGLPALLKVLQGGSGEGGYPPDLNDPASEMNAGNAPGGPASEVTVPGVPMQAPPMSPSASNVPGASPAGLIPPSM